MNCRPSGARLVALGVLLLSSSLANAGTGYTFTVLDRIDGAASFATAINNVGQVVGYSLSNGYVSNAHAMLWNGATATDLGTLGGRSSYAAAINDFGQIAGYSTLALPSGAGDVVTHATLWNGTTSTDLGTLGGSDSWAYAINNAGQVAGSSKLPNNSACGSEGCFPVGSHATVWNGSVATDLQGPPGTVYNYLYSGYSSAYGINNAGQVVGQLSGYGVLWDGTTTTGIGRGDSQVSAVNNAGQVVGWDNGYFTSRAMLWAGGVTTDLGTLGGPDSKANAINNSGQIVGTASTGVEALRPHAVLWNGTAAIDLNSFLDASAKSAGWELLEATGINDKGWIVGNAVNSTGYYAFVLAPIPEPETYAMLSAGLLLIGVRVRRREAKALG